MKKKLRKKFILFAMSAVTILLAVLIGAINGLSWMMLDRQSSSILHLLASGDANIPQTEFPEPKPFSPPMDLDMIKSARFFTVRTDQNGTVLEVNIDQISSVTAEQAVQYAAQVADSTGKIDAYKYEVKSLGSDRLLFFLDTSNQLGMFMIVFSISSALACVSWLAVLLFVILLSGRVVRPIAAGMEKQKQFITNAGHELKTPLAIIQSNNDASTLLHGETKYSKNIRLQTQRLNTLMTNLLTLAKLDEEIKLPTEPVDISALICGMLSSYEETAAQKHMLLSARIPPHIFMLVHRDTFSQMLSILLDNAVKYTPEHGTIAVTLKETGGHIVITEENTCESASHADPEQLFERFYRGDSARTQDTAFSGYGIGLSAARTIAETFSGTLTAAYPEKGKIRFTARF